MSQILHVREICAPNTLMIWNSIGPLTSRKDLIILLIFKYFQLKGNPQPMVAYRLQFFIYDVDLIFFLGLAEIPNTLSQKLSFA